MKDHKNAGSTRTAKSPNPTAEAPLAPTSKSESTSTNSTDGDGSAVKTDDDARKVYLKLVADLNSIAPKFESVIKDVGVKTFVESDAFARLRKTLDAMANDLAALDKTDPRNCLPFKVRPVKEPESLEEWVKRYKSEGGSYAKDMLDEKGMPNLKAKTLWFHEGQDVVTYKVLFEAGEDGIAYADLLKDVEARCKKEGVEFEEKRVRSMVSGMCLGSPDWAVPGSGTLKGLADGKDGKLVLDYDVAYAKEWHSYFAPVTAPPVPKKGK